MASFLADHQAFLSLVLLLAMLLAFARETLPPSGVAVIGAASYLLLGFVSTDEVLVVFSNPAAIAIGAMLVLSAALVRTGTLEALASVVLEIAKERPVVALSTVLLVAMLASAFINSTPVVVILIPLVVTLAGAIGIHKKQLLIPLSYFAILGGTCTLIGTSTNLLVNSIARQNGHPGFGIFDITPVGLCGAVVGVVFVLVAGRFLLPRDPAANDVARDGEKKADIITECRIGPAFRDLGETYQESRLLQPRGVTLVALYRGGRRLDADLAETQIEEKDRVVLRVSSIELATLRVMDGLDIGVRVRRRPSENEEAEKVARVTVVSENRIIGQRLTDAYFVSRYPVSVIGVRRRRNLAGPDLARLLVKPGDQLWLTGTESALRGVAEDDYLVFSTLPHAKPFKRNRAALAIVTLLLVIVAAAINVIPLSGAAIIGIGFLLLFRCLDTSDAWDALNADVLILIYAMLVIGTGLQNTGAVDLIIGLAYPMMQTVSPFALLLIIYTLTSILTETVTNNAVAVIMTPLVMSLAERLGIDPTPLLVAVMFGASASFATPVGYQTNTLVHIEGNYRFTEFMRIGVPMNVVVGLACCLAISFFYG